MIAACFFFFVAAVFAVLFWVWAVRGILAKIYKTSFGKKNIISGAVISLLSGKNLSFQGAVCALSF